MRASRANVAGLQDTATTVAHLRARQARAPAPGALARRIEHHGVEALELGRHQRAAEQVARLGLDRLEAVVVGGRALQRRDRSRIVVRRGDARAFGEPQRERPDAGRTDRRLSCALPNAPPPAAPAPPRRPRSPAGTRPAAARPARGPSCTVGAARCATISPWRVSRASRCVSATPRQRGRALRRQRARAAHVDVEPGVGRRHLDVERLAASPSSASAIAQAAAIAPSSDGASTGQRSIGTM